MKQLKYIFILYLFIHSGASWSFGSDSPELVKQTAQLIKLVNLAKQQYAEIMKTKKFIEDLKDIESIRDIPLEYIHNEDMRFLMEDLYELEDMYENPMQYPDDRVIGFRKAIREKWKDSTYRRAGIYRKRSDQLYKRMDKIDKVEESTGKNFEMSLDNNTERDAANITATSTAFLANVAAQKQKEEEQQRLFNLHQHAEMEKTLKDAEKLYGAMSVLGQEEEY